MGSVKPSDLLVAAFFAGVSLSVSLSSTGLWTDPDQSDLKKNLLALPPHLCVTVSNTMVSSTNASHDPAELGELERSILLVVWRRGSVTADEVREELDRPLKSSTVRTVLRRL